jgi:ABC-type multidrug transport system fused ATPase/permease subunit
MIFIHLLQEFIQEHTSEIWLYAISAGLTYVLIAVVIPFLYSKIGDIETSNDWKKIIPWLIGIYIIFIIFFIIKKLMLIRLEPGIQSFLKIRMMRLYLEKHEIEYNDSNVALHMMNMITAVQSVTAIFLWILETVLPVLVLMVIITVYLCIRLPLIGILLLSFNALVYTTLCYRIHPLIELFYNHHHHFEQLVGRLDNSFSNLMNIYLNNAIDTSINEYTTYDKEYIKHIQHHQLYLQYFSYSTRFIIYGFAIITLVYLFLQWKRSKITKATLFEYAIIILFYCGAFDMLCEQSSIVSKDIIVAISFEPMLTLHHPAPQSTVSDSIQSIRFNDVGCTLQDKVIFTHLNFQLRAGERIALVGQSGSGKSTLVKLVLGFMTPTSGTIYINDRDITTLSVRDIRSHIHYINQRTHLFEDTILANMMYGTTVTRDEILAVLTQYELWSIFDESGSNSVSAIEREVILHGSNISLGMQKVIMMIRGVFHPCSVLFIDEPFTSIDPPTRHKVLQLIRDKTQGKTVCIITHDMDGIDTVVDKTVHINDLV